MSTATERVIVSLLLLVCSPLSVRGSPDRDDLIAWYFDLGYEYKLIVCFLWFIHGVRISLRHLSRIIRQLGLRRRNYTLDRRLLLRTIQAMKVCTVYEYY